MDIQLKRTEFTDKSTIGNVSINGKFECYILEDVDRGLIDSMGLTEINMRKIYGKTCIPYGRYEVKVTYSNRFKKDLPILLDVKGYEGIRIHTGNSDYDTLGCLLPCKSHKDGKGYSSTIAFDGLFSKINNAIKLNEKVFINIIK